MVNSISSNMTSALNPSSQEMQNAAEQASSVYYGTTLQSMKAMEDSMAPSTEPAVEISKVEATETRSFWRRTVDWFGNLFGIGSPSKKTDNHAVVGTEHVSSEILQNQSLVKAIAELNKELIKQLQDVADFEKEMRESSSAQLDKIILVEVVSSSHFQRELSEGVALDRRLEIIQRRELNNKLQKLYYNLKDEIDQHTKVGSHVRIASIVVTAATVVTFVALFATGIGGVFALATPLLGVSKAALMLSQGTIKHIKTGKEGELFIVNHKMKRNSESIQEDLKDAKALDADGSKLIKTIRNHLDESSSVVKEMNR